MKFGGVSTRIERTGDVSRLTSTSRLNAEFPPTDDSRGLIRVALRRPDGGNIGLVTASGYDGRGQTGRTRGCCFTTDLDVISAV